MSFVIGYFKMNKIEKKYIVIKTGPPIIPSLEIVSWGISLISVWVGNEINFNKIPAKKYPNPTVSL